jgi:hypothetical protein
MKKTDERKRDTPHPACQTRPACRTTDQKTPPGRIIRWSPTGLRPWHLSFRDSALEGGGGIPYRKPFIHAFTGVAFWYGVKEPGGAIYREPAAVSLKEKVNPSTLPGLSFDFAWLDLARLTPCRACRGTG